MVSPDRPDDDPDATQDAPSALEPRATLSTDRADLPVYRPRNHGARAVAVAILAAVIAAALVWLLLSVIL